MPRLINIDTALDFFNFPELKELRKLTRRKDIETQESINLIDPIDPIDGFLEATKEWAKIRFPNSSNKDQCAFAALIEYFCTGWYGGYGTELYQKERVVEHKTHSFYMVIKDHVNEPFRSILLIHFIASHQLQKSSLETDVEENIKKAVLLLEETKKNFKSKQVKDAKDILVSLLS